MPEFTAQPIYGFNKYPPVGQDDWKYAFAAAQVRSLESTLIGRNVFVEMANAVDFNAACDCLSGTEYAFAGTANTFAEIEQSLIKVRSDVRKLFNDLIDDGDIVEILKARTDFDNLRLALRRLVTEKPIGIDYSNEGHVPADKFEEVLEQENYIEFPLFLQEAVERAVLRYYQDKDIRQIDHGIDMAASDYYVAKAQEINNIFLLELARLDADLSNIRTILRLKFRDADDRSCFVDGGYVDKSILVHGFNVSMDGVAALFAATPYFDIVDAGINYLIRENSFLKLEELCDSHRLGFLRSTSQITAGSQPVIAYLLRKEYEIRKVRMLLTGKKNHLEPKLLLDRLAHSE